MCWYTDRSRCAVKKKEVYNHYFRVIDLCAASLFHCHKQKKKDGNSSVSSARKATKQRFSLLNFEILLKNNCNELIWAFNAETVCSLDWYPGVCWHGNPKLHPRLSHCWALTAEVWGKNKSCNFRCQSLAVVYVAALTLTLKDIAAFYSNSSGNIILQLPVHYLDN